MKPIRYGTPRRSFVIMDVIAAMGLTAFALLIATGGARQYVFARLDCDARRVLRLEAETALARVRAGLPPRDANALPHGVTLELERSPGSDPWAGLTLVRVRAAKQILGGRWVRAELSAYTLAPEASP